MQLGQLKMIITLIKKWIRSPMTYPQIHNLSIFPYPLKLLKSDLRVKSYAHFSKGLSNRPSWRTLRWGVGRMTDRQYWPLWGPTTTFPEVFLPFPLLLNPRLCHFDPKSTDFSQFKPRNIIKTYPSQIIKSKRRKLEAREEKKISRTLLLFHGFYHQVCGISLVGIFHPLGT